MNKDKKIFHSLQTLTNIAGSLEGYDKAIADINTKIDDYERVRENLRNNNAILENIKIKLAHFEKSNVEIEGIIARLADFEKAEENIRNNNTEIEGIKTKLIDFEKAEENIRNNNAIIESLAARIEELATTCELQKVKISMLEKKLGKQNGSVSACQTEQVHESNMNDAYNGIDYFDFENHFRGSMKQIQEAQKIYVDYFKGHKNVIDLGCGRGEFLELLRENDIDAQGVELYGEFVEMCRLRKLNVTQADAIAFLKSQKKVGGIFAAQLIEHISVGQLVTLCELAYAKLEEGGYVVLETPNPRSLSVFTNSFYMDPSHNKPVHPLTLQYIMEKAGFKETEIIYTSSSRPAITIPTIESENMDAFNHAMKQVEDILFGSQDYAIVARR